MDDTTSLPEDVIREILLRVDLPAPLFRCAVTCKRWSRLVADASSQRSSSGASSTFLAGLFIWKKWTKPFVPTPRSFGLGARCLNSLFTGGTPGLLDRAVPLVSRQGLLLVRLANALTVEYDPVVRLAVYNLLTGDCHVLPPLSLVDSNFGCSGYAFLTCKEDCCSSNSKHLQQHSFSPWPIAGSSSAFFKVLIMGAAPFERPRNLHTFSSGESGWSGPRELSFDTNIVYEELRHPNAVVCGGAAHWVVGDWSGDRSKSLYILNLDVETCRVSLTKIVAPSEDKFCSLTYSEPLLGVSANGMLTVLFLPRPSLRVHICTRHEDIKESDHHGTTAGWLRTRVLELKPPQQVAERPIHLSLLGEKGGMLLLKGSKRQVYTADIETGVMEEVTSWFPPLDRRAVVLLETDWPAFFISRFGGQ